MKKYFSLFFVICIVMPIGLFAITPEALKKYPHQLLNDDHGILNEANLKRYTYQINSRPFSGKFSGLDYWRCYETQNITAGYKKGDYDPDEKIIRSAPYIRAKPNSTTVYEYVLRRSFSLEYARDKVSEWRKLMKNQQFVCIGGYFVQTTKRNSNGKQISEQLWVYENIKTKKGCDSYFSGWCK